MKKRKKHAKISPLWRIVGAGFIIIVILIVVMMAAAYAHGASIPLVDAVQHVQSSLVELFVMSMAALVAIIKGVEK